MRDKYLQRICQRMTEKIKVGKEWRKVLGDHILVAYRQDQDMAPRSFGKP